MPAQVWSARGLIMSSAQVYDVLSCAAGGNDSYEYQRTSAIRYLGSDSSSSVMMGLTQDSVQNSTSSQAVSWPQQRTSFNCPQVLGHVLAQLLTALQTLKRFYLLANFGSFL